MQTIILAGGKGFRLPEETLERPKPLVEIGSIPIIQHIMNIYKTYFYGEFIVCLGYKGNMIKQYFKDYFMLNNDITIKYRTCNVDISRRYETIEDDWEVSLVNTGENTNTGGRILQVKPYITDRTFCMTYSDGLTNANLSEVENFHQKHKKLATFLAVKSPSKFGITNFTKNGMVTYFGEKSKADYYINGGFFFLESDVFKYIKDNNTSWEFDVLPALVKDHQLMAYKYDGFWKCMDSLKDKIELEEMWNQGASWKTW